MASAKKFNDNILSTSRESFIVTIVFHPCSVILFSLYINRAAYLIVMLFLSQKFFNLAEMNFPPPLAQKTFIDLLHCFFYHQELHLEDVHKLVFQLQVCNS